MVKALALVTDRVTVLTVKIVLQPHCCLYLCHDLSYSFDTGYSDIFIDNGNNDSF